MKILIVSDTHRQNENYLKVIKEVSPLDLVIHCGDIEGSELLIGESAGCPVEMVMGNNDFFSTLPKEKELQIGRYNVLLTHGHYYYVSSNNEVIKEEAKARGFDIVIYGHTHRPMIEVEKDIIAINPGSLSYPRQAGKRPSYIIMDVEPDKEVQFHLHFL